MVKFNTILILLFLSTSVIGQSKKKLAYQKAVEAISLMDNGKVDESIVLLKEAKELDNKSYDYPYELAYAYYLKENYSQSVRILEDLKSHKDVNARLFQLLGNSYDMLEKTKTALSIYEEGLSKFPNAGILYLEMGNIYYNSENYGKAIRYYEKGIEVDPKFPSNYYWAAKLYCRSNERIWGVIYGELFMNLEPNTDRTSEISELLFTTYKKSLIIKSDSSAAVDFSRAMSIDISKKFKLPFPMIFGLDMTTSLGLNMFSKDTSISIASLNSVRNNFIGIWYQKKRNKEFPNVLFDFHKKLESKKHFESYNYWVFMKGDKEEFIKWKSEHKKEWDSFIKWYSENGLVINSSKKFHRSQY